MVIELPQTRSFQIKREHRCINLRIADFCPAEIRRPVWEVKVIASHFFLQRKHKNKDKSLVIGSEVFSLNYSFVYHASNLTLLISLCVKLLWPHLIFCRVILLCFFKNGDKLKILWIFPSAIPLVREKGRKGTMFIMKLCLKQPTLFHVNEILLAGNTRSLSHA